MYISSLQFTITLIEKLGLALLFGNPWCVGSAPPNSYSLQPRGSSGSSLVFTKSHPTDLRGSALDAEWNRMTRSAEVGTQPCSLTRGIFICGEGLGCGIM